MLQGTKGLSTKTTKNPLPTVEVGLAADLKVSATFGRLSAAVLCFHRHSRFIRIEKQLPDGTDSELWGLQCPEETGQDSWRILTEQRLARIADAQGPRLRRPV